MRNPIYTLLFLFVFFAQNAFTQQDYNAFYKNSDPARDTIDPNVKWAVHKNFLNNAITSNDSLKIILGNLYLSQDYIKIADHAEAMNHLEQAEKFAAARKDTLLLGRINHKKGIVYSMLRNIPESMKHFETSLNQSTIVKDSQTIAISMEQLGTKLAWLKEYEKSNEYHRKAIEIIERHCPKKSMTVALINFGNSLDDQGYTEKAIEMYRKAIKIGEEIEDDYEIYAAKLNLAYTYSINDNLELALELYKQCVEVYRQNNWLYYLVDAYGGLSATYEKMGNSDSAYYYFREYHYLNDSVAGVDVQNEITRLEEKAIIQQKDIAILIQKETILRNQQRLKNAIIAILIILAISSWIGWFFFHKTRKTKLLLAENRKSLSELANMLAIKNAELRDLSAQKVMPKNDSKTDNDQTLENVNFYDMSILTDLDWQTFKGLFERSYPRYLQKIRDQFPSITPAEERLFIFIKLQISNKEAANILGVQTETIKKTRTRLKKRLGLSKEESLNLYVSNFR